MQKPTTLRLPKEQAEQVARIAESLGVSESAVIRWAVDALLQHAAAHDGHLVLPLNLGDQWAKVRPAAEDSPRIGTDPRNAGTASAGRPSPGDLNSEVA